MSSSSEIALDYYMNAANAHSDLCDRVAHGLATNRLPTEREIEAVEDAGVILAAARRLYGEATAG